MCKILWSMIIFLLVTVLCPDCVSFSYLRNPSNCQYKSEALYAELIKKLPYENVRRAVGTYRGHPHMWVEVWEGGRWWVEDPTLGLTDVKYYRVSHYSGLKTIMRGEGKLKELEERR